MSRVVSCIVTVCGLSVSSASAQFVDAFASFSIDSLAGAELFGIASQQDPFTFDGSVFLSEDEQPPFAFFGEVGSAASVGNAAAELGGSLQLEFSSDVALFDLQISGEAFSDGLTGGASADFNADYNFMFTAVEDGVFDIDLLLVVETPDDLDDPDVNASIDVFGAFPTLEITSVGQQSFFSEVSFRQSVLAGDTVSLNADLFAAVNSDSALQIENIRLFAQVTLVPTPSSAAVLAGAGLLASRRRRPSAHS